MIELSAIIATAVLAAYIGWCQIKRRRYGMVITLADFALSAWFLYSLFFVFSANPFIATKFIATALFCKMVLHQTQ